MFITPWSPDWIRFAVSKVLSKCWLYVFCILYISLKEFKAWICWKRVRGLFYALVTSTNSCAQQLETRGKRNERPGKKERMNRCLLNYSQFAVVLKNMYFSLSFFKIYFPTTEHLKRVYGFFFRATPKSWSPRLEM